jgi:hypothetical protein
MTKLGSQRIRNKVLKKDPTLQIRKVGFAQSQHQPMLGEKKR